MSSNITSQGIAVSFKGNLTDLKSATAGAKTLIQGVGNAAKTSSASITSSFKAATSSMQSFASSTRTAGEGSSKLASLQSRAGVAAKQLAVAEANAALMLKRAADMENSGKASAEQLAVAQSKAALAAQQVQSKQVALANAMQKVVSEEKSLANATAQDTREMGSFANGLNVIKGALGSVGTGIRSAVSGLASFASVLGGPTRGALSITGSALRSIVSGLVEFGSKGLTSGTQVSSGMQKAATSVQHFKSESSSMHVSFMSGIKSMTGGLLDFTSKLGMAVFGIRAMIDASVGLGRALLSPAADAEQTAAAFTGLLGSAQKATAFLKDLRKFAATTPFEFPELASAARKMLSFGFATRDVIPMMTRLGDAVATMGGGSDEIDRAVTAIGQMHAKTKITAEEMNQLTELGIPGWDMLAKAMGKTTAEVMDLASKGLIPADKGIEALLKGMEKFKGGMEAQSKTFKGMLSNLKDGVTLALMAFGGPILESAKVGLGELIKLVSSPAFERFATVTGRGVASVIDDINKAASKAKSGLKAFLGDLDLSPLTNGINKARSSINKFAEGINPIPVQLFLSSIKYLGVQMDRTFGIVKGTGIFLFHQLSDVIDIATGKTTKFHKSFDVVNGVMVKTRSPLQTLIGDGFFKLGSMIAIAAENVHRFGTYLQGINWMPVILGAKAFAEGAGKKASDTLTIIARIVDNKVKPAFEGIKKVIEGPVFQKFTGIMGDLATSAGGLAGSIFSLWTQLSPIGSLFKGNADVGQKFSDVLSGASSIINNYVIPAINGLSGFIRDMGPVIQPIGAKLLDMFGGFMGWLKDNGPTIMQIGGDIFKGIGDIIKDISPVIKDQFLPALDNLGKTVGPIVSDFLKWEQKTGGVKEGMSALKDVIGIVVVVASWLVNAVTFVINAFNWWKDVCYGLGFALGTLFKSIGDWFGGIGTWFRDRFNEVVTNIKNSYPGIYDAIIKPFVDAWNRISGIVANIGNAMYSVTHPGQSGGGGGDMGQFAGGVENFKGGMAIVGEKGPEMVRLPRGSDVYTASETKAMIRGMNSRMPAQSNFAQPAYKYPSAASSGGSAAPVIINNYITLEPAKVELDGREIGESAGRYVVSQVRSHGGLQ